MNSADAERPTPDESPFLEAEFVGDATSVTDVMTVRIPGYDGGEHDFEAEWVPRVDDDGAPVLPADGDWALVAESDKGTWSVLLWRPSG